jgi:hypothetical protein
MHRPSEGSCCCREDGWSNVASLGPHASDDSPGDYEPLSDPLSGFHYFACIMLARIFTLLTQVKNSLYRPSTGRDWPSRHRAIQGRMLSV